MKLRNYPKFLRSTLPTATLVAALLAATPLQAREIPVVTSLKPLELLVHAVATEQISVSTLIPDGASPHTYQLRPSERRRLEQARAIFWVGPDMETFLGRLLGGEDFAHRSHALAGDDRDHEPAHHDEHQHAPAGHENHDDHDEHGDHGTGKHDDHPGDHEKVGEDDGHGHEAGEDPHIWLDPQLALAMSHRIAGVLSDLDGTDDARIRANLAAFETDLTRAETEIRERLQAARHIDLFVYHDAFGRFARHYGLTIAGVLTPSPERNPGARHLARIEARLSQAEHPCLLSEPQFSGGLWQAISDNIDVAMSTWDPLASDIPPGRDGYIRFQHSLADAVLACLPEDTQ